MKHWCNGVLTFSGEALTEIHIKCEIFQGDALSPLLFCVALNSLSNIIRKNWILIHIEIRTEDTPSGQNQAVWQARTGDWLSHHHVRIFSDDIGMKLKEAK
jgi:hypothetical protein